MGKRTSPIGEMRPGKVPLDKLHVCSQNVRKKEHDEGQLRQLAASIKHHGLLNPLIVSGTVVIGGGRRLAALQLLAAAKDIKPDWPVPCTIVPDDAKDDVDEMKRRNVELSLAENSARERLHPVDQAEAFKALRDQLGMTDKQLAERFGVGPRTVSRRIRVAGVAPELLQQAREGKLSLGMLEAVCASTDHERQIQAAKDFGGNEWNGEDRARQWLRSEHKPISHTLVQFVGEQAYRDAGGGTYEDIQHYLYDGDEDDPKQDVVRVSDPNILVRLATQKLEELGTADRKKGWPNVVAGLDYPNRNWGAEEEIRRESPRGLDEGVLKSSRVCIYLDRQGKLQRDVLVSSKALREAEAKKEREERIQQHHEQVKQHEAAVKAAEEAGEEAPPPPEAPVDLEPEDSSLELSWALRNDLTQMRTSLLRRRVAGIADFAVVFDVLLYYMAMELYQDRAEGQNVYTGHDIDLHADDGGTLRVEDADAEGEELEGLPTCVIEAERGLVQRETTLLEPWLETEGHDERFAKLRAMDTDDKQRLLACCLARMLFNKPAGAGVADRALTGFVNWPVEWRPDKSVLKRLNTAQLLDIAANKLTDDDRDMAALRKLKKGELVEAMQVALATYRSRNGGKGAWLPKEVFGDAPES